MSEPGPNAETKTIVGVWSQKPDERNGWVEFAVDVGSQYPVRVATMLPALIETARGLRDETATWTYTEYDAVNKDGTPRINEKTGKPFRNRRLEKVEAGEHAPTGSPASRSSSAPSSSEQMSKEDWARKDSAADLRACIAISVQALTHTMPADPSDEELATFINRVGTLSESFHRQVQIERSGEGVPFE